MKGEDKPLNDKVKARRTPFGGKTGLP